MDFNNLWTFSFIFMSNEKDLIQWMMQQGWFQSEMKCVTCSSECTLGKRMRKLDGYTWRCQNDKNHETSVRKFSVICLTDIIEFTRCFLQYQSLLNCSHNSGLAYKSTCVDWANFHRELFKEYVFTTMFDLQGI